jgi:hypothetical protein
VRGDLARVDVNIRNQFGKISFGIQSADCEGESESHDNVTYTRLVYCNDMTLSNRPCLLLADACMLRHVKTKAIDISKSCETRCCEGQEEAHCEPRLDAGGSDSDKLMQMGLLVMRRRRGS